MVAAKKTKTAKKCPDTAKSGPLGDLFPCISPGKSYIIGTDFSRQAGGPQDRAQIERVKEN